MLLQTILTLGEEVPDHHVESLLVCHVLEIVVSQLLNHLVGVDLGELLQSLLQHVVAPGQLILLSNSLEVFVEASELGLYLKDLEVRVALSRTPLQVVMGQLGADQGGLALVWT